MGLENFIAGIRSPALRELVHCWNEVRGSKLMPTWTDLSPSVLHPYFALLWGFHYDATTSEFTSRLAGKHVKEWLGANFWGAKLETIHPPHVVKGARAFLDKVVLGPQAGKCSGRLFTIGGKPVTGERIALPLALDGINADGILGASDYGLPLDARDGAVELIHENMTWCQLVK